MSRLARLDAVGLLQHVMVRGIEKRDIFIDDRDRRHFLDRFSELLLKTETACLAWCLMSNHVHLLLRPQNIKLSFFMRRLLTSYALYFNLRHKRVGHLFQNRYKSIVCEEDTYLLELIRYIHLNPVRAGLVRDGDGLQRYQWSGHAVLMGETELAGQVTSEILVRFGHDAEQARGKYEGFVLEAVAAGHRDELGSGGVSSTPFALSRRPGEEACDSRILGGGDFVEEIWADQEQAVPEPRMSLQSLLQEVASELDVEVAALCHPTKSRQICNARALACYLALRELGYSGVAISRVLRITPAGVTVAANRGEAMVKEGHARDIILKIRMLIC